MKKILAAAAALVFSCTAAQAATTSFDFLSGANGAIGWTSGTLDYVSDGISLSVSSANYSGGSVSDSGRVRQYNGHGLTVKNGRDDAHYIDGNGSNDVAVFDFSEDVTVKSVSFNYNGNDDQFAYFFDEGDNNSLDLINGSLDANPTGDIYTFLGALLRNGDLFGIGAIGSDDDFKITAMTVERVSVVPLPAALPLYAAGIAVLGFVGYRRKKKLEAAA